MSKNTLIRKLTHSIASGQRMGAAVLQTAAIVALAFGSASLANAAVPPAPSQPTTTCDAIIGGQCYVNGSFTISSYSAGAHHYQVCRSNDTNTWGGCNVVMSTNSGPSFTVSGSHLPSEGARRAYRFKACDAADNCTLWSANTELYVTLDTLPPPVPSQPTAPCDMWVDGVCTVNGPFILASSSAATHHYRVCRSYDTAGWGGCNVVITSNAGASFTVSGSHLPSQGARRAYRYSACDALGNCTPWTANAPVYVSFDSEILTCPSIIGIVEPRACAPQKVAMARESGRIEPPSEAEILGGLRDSLQSYSLETIDPAGMHRMLEATGKLRLNLEGAVRELVLEPKDLRAPSFREVAVTDGGEVELPAAPATTFRGFVAGVPDSDVRLLVHPEVVMGYVDLDGTRYFVDPVSKFAAGAGAEQAVIYRESDLRPEPGVSCASSELRRYAEELSASTVVSRGSSPVTLDKATTLKQVEIAIDADYEYYAKHGLSVTATNAHIQGVINMVDGFYDAVGLTFVITYQRVFTTANDPYYTCNILNQWCEVFQEWERYQSGIARDVAYLFSGKALYGRTQLTQPQARIRGVSGLFGTICAQPDKAYVVSTDYREAGLVAHEIGHALNAEHVSNSMCPQTDCGQDSCDPPTQSGVPSGPVMCPSIQEPTTGFVQTSINKINSFVNASGSCLTPVP